MPVFKIIRASMVTGSANERQQRLSSLAGSPSGPVPLSSLSCRSVFAARRLRNGINPLIMVSRFGVGVYSFTTPIGIMDFSVKHVANKFALQVASVNQSPLLHLRGGIEDNDVLFIVSDRANAYHFFEDDGKCANFSFERVIYLEYSCQRPWLHFFCFRK